MDLTHPSESMSPSYEPGDIILGNCRPFFRAVLHNTHKYCCSNCLKESKQKLGACTGCHLVRYCNDHCQEQDLKNAHEAECQSACFRDYCHEPGTKIDCKVFLFRMYATLKMQPELTTKQFLLHDGTTRCLNDLLQDPLYLRRGAGMQMESKAMAELLNLENPGNPMPLDYFQRLEGIQNSNGFAVLDEDRTHWTGFGVYLEPGVFDHSCKPTALCVNDGLKLQVRAIAPISRGEQPTISLIKKTVDGVHRKRLLERLWVDCHCDKCEFVTDAAVDYGKLNTTMASLSKLEAIPSARCKWIFVLYQHLEILEVLREVYHEFDDRITEQYRTAFNIAMNLGVDLRDIAGLVDDTRQHLATTYGVGHIYFKKFESRVSAAPSCSSASRD